MYNTFQSIAIIIPLMLKLFHLWPAAPSLCPCILSDMTPPNLPCSLHDRMFHLAHVLFPDLESAVSVQSLVRNGVQRPTSGGARCGKLVFISNLFGGQS